MIYSKKFKILAEFYRKNCYKFLLIISLSASFLALSMAYISQYFFGLEPCILCLYQRQPLFLIIIISITTLIIKKTSKKFTAIAIFCCAILFFINAIIALYHSGVEMKWFDGPKTCSTSAIENIDDLAQLTKTILSTKAVKCDQPQFYFMKLTMANWNFIYSLGLFLVLAWQLFNSILSRTKNSHS